jgi:ornithine--oxo-acid transaminase
MYILGKALGGGVLPVSAVTSSKEVLGVFTYGSHGSTFGGNPLASRVALESLCVIRDEKLVENAAELGPWFLNELRSIPSTHIELIRGKGLMIGMVLKKEARGARRFCEALMKLGLLCKETHENVIRFAPPLIIKKSELETALEKIRSVLMNPELL